MHLSAVAGPLAWTVTALFWNGAVAVHSHNLPGRVVANIFIWVILAIGLFHISVRQDYILGYCFSLLTLCKFPYVGMCECVLLELTPSSSGHPPVLRQDHRPAMDLCIRHFRRLHGDLALYIQR